MLRTCCDFCGVSGATHSIMYVAWLNPTFSNQCTWSACDSCYPIYAPRRKRYEAMVKRHEEQEKAFLKAQILDHHFTKKEKKS